jgi:hypothetical protein
VMVARVHGPRVGASAAGQELRSDSDVHPWSAVSSRLGARLLAIMGMGDGLAQALVKPPGV